MHRRSVTGPLLLTLALATALPIRAELPKFPLRADWVGDEVLPASTAGGPEAVPERLDGLWRVSLCVKPGLHRGHAWIRYENLHSGEVHTVGRFQKHVRSTRRRSTGEVLYPRTRQSGLHWDYDWRFEHEVRVGKYLIDSVVIRDPVIFGHEDVKGHAIVRDNCITYARDAWQFYSGQHFDLAVLHTPQGFLRAIDADSSPTPTVMSARGGNVSQASDPRTATQPSSSLLRRLPPVQTPGEPGRYR